MSSSEHSDGSAPGTPVKSATPSSRGSSPAPSPPKQQRKAILEDSDDDSDHAPEARKQLSDSDDDAPRAKAGGNLFGELSGSSDDDSDGGQRKEQPEKRAAMSDSDAESRGSLDGLHGIVMANPDEIEAEVEKEQEQIHDTEAVAGRVQLEYSEDPPYFVRMPNFLSVATHPFDPAHYEEDEDDDQVKLDDEGRNRLKLRVENTLRWRERVEENGEKHRESNAKIVRWSDGTMSLYLGNEIFEVTMMELNKNNLPHLYVKQPGFMSAQAVMTHRMTFRPHSTDSQTHRKVTLNMADRSRKNAQVKVMDDVGLNPEITRRENAKKEEELLRAHIRRTTIPRNNFRVRRPMGGGEYSDDEEASSARRGRKKKEAPLIGASSESEDETEPTKKSGTESDSDEEYRRRKQQQKKQIVTSDEESD